MSFRKQNVAGSRRHQKQTAKNLACPSCERKSALKITFPENFGGLYCVKHCRYCGWNKQILIFGNA